MSAADLMVKLMGYCKACDETGCLEWVGGFGGTAKRTPIFHLPGTRTERNSMPAYQAAWVLSHKPLKDGQVVYRKCLNYKCINVEHCATGTKKQMWAHIVKSGKHKGLPHRKIANLANRSKQMLPPEKVREVEALLADGVMRKDAAVKAGVSCSAVTDIKRGRHFHSASRQQLIRGASIFSMGQP